MKRSKQSLIKRIESRLHKELRIIKDLEKMGFLGQE